MGQDQIPHRRRPVRRCPRSFSGHVFSSGAVFSEGGRHARGRGRPVAQDHLRAGLFRHAGQFTGARTAARGGFRWPSRPGIAKWAARLAQERLGRFSRRRLFPLDRRTEAIRPLRPRCGARRRGGRSVGGIPGFHRVLHRLRPGRRHHDALCADGGPVDRRRLSFPDDARQGRRHGHSVLALRAGPGVAIRHRAGHVDVLVFGDQEGNRDRLAPRGA